MPQEIFWTAPRPEAAINSSETRAKLERVELIGIEPMTSGLQSQRSPS
jgi:hypothetical protein